MVLLVPAILAQQGKIDGVVTDVATGETVPGASVVIEGTSQGAATQVDGYFFINNVRPGTHTLVVSFVGYVTQRVEGVRVSAGLTSTRNVQLNEEAVGLDEIVVTSERPIVQLDVSANIASLNSEAFEDLPVAGVSEVLDLQAGIEPGLTIRGSGGDQIAFVVDGMSLRTGRSGQPFTNISYTALEEVQVQTGGFNAEYGNVRSGIVNVTTKDPSRTRYTVDALYRYQPAQSKSLEGLGGGLGKCNYSGPVTGDCDSWFIRPFLDPAVAMDGTGNGAWDSYTQNQYNAFEGWKVLADRLVKDEKFDVTPQDMQEYFKHTPPQRQRHFQTRLRDGCYGGRPSASGSGQQTWGSALFCFLQGHADRIPLSANSRRIPVPDASGKTDFELCPRNETQHPGNERHGTRSEQKPEQSRCSGVWRRNPGIPVVGNRCTDGG